MRTLARWASSSEHTTMMLLALLIGSLGGLGAVAFRALIEAVQRIGWGPGSYSLELVAEHPWWWIVLLPAAGGLIVGLLVYFGAREAKGHGVPEVMEAVAMRSGVIRPRLVVIKSLASAISIGSGGSVGREGPIVQIGSALGSTLGQWFKIRGARLKTLVGCGAAAGIAATFNAPVAGALFAVEVILGDFGVSQFSPIVISSVVATVISRHFLGDFPAFIVPQYEMLSAWELIFYAALGLAAGVVGHAFVKILYRFEDAFDAIPIRQNWILTPLGGLAVGAMALAFPQVLGVGYEAIEQALRGELMLQMLLALIFVKLLATSITIGSGGSGGVFAPSLFLGSMIGGLVGVLAHGYFPEQTAASGAYALVGMGAVVAATTRAPITAILIIFELTSDYKLIVPLMESCILATILAAHLNKESIYTMKLVRRGIELFRGHERSVLRSMQVAEVLDSDVVTVRNEEPLGKLLDRVTETTRGFYYVVDDDQRLYGIISLADLRRSLRSFDALSDLIVAGDLVHDEVPFLTPEQDLDCVMKLFSGKQWEELPVVESAGDPKLVGGLSRRQLMDAYNQELMRRDMAAGLGGGVAATETGDVMLGGGYRMIELELPTEFQGKSLREIDLRARFSAQVLLIRRRDDEGQSEEIVPAPDTELRPGDRLVLMGTERELGPLRRLG